jgi:hypothetical protein
MEKHLPMVRMFRYKQNNACYPQMFFFQKILIRQPQSLLKLHHMHTGHRHINVPSYNKFHNLQATLTHPVDPG